MFKDYLSNPDTYQKLESFFTSALNEHLYSKRINPAKYRTPYYNTTCVDGTRLMEANPIFSVRNTSTQNILRVVIHEAVKSYSTTHNKRDEAKELCLIIKISDLDRATNDINKWIDEQENQGAI
jgi:HD-GYP domain-containing protein (c-di-GMP phosphodiesterase class II)